MGAGIAKVPGVPDNSMSQGHLRHCSPDRMLHLTEQMSKQTQKASQPLTSKFTRSQSNFVGNGSESQTNEEDANDLRSKFVNRGRKKNRVKLSESQQVRMAIRS